MKNQIILQFIVLVWACISCAQSETKGGKTSLSAAEFQSKLKLMPEAPLLDVRTPEEFSKGHLENALNLNWNGDDFENQIKNLNNSKPVFVYCLSGGRSSSAARKLRNEGFKEVYELEGGILQWRSAGLPETSKNSDKTLGMSKTEFDKLLETDKIVLVDFYAEWCAPCKKMKPFLDEISREMADKVVVIRIDADLNPELAQIMEIDALPILQIYKNKSLTWSYKGYIEKTEVVKHLL